MKHIASSGFMWVLVFTILMVLMCSVASATVSITLDSVSPEGSLPTNYTGVVVLSYMVEHTSPLNYSSLAMLYGLNYTLTGDMHSYLAVPPNSISSEGIYRAPNRNTTPYLSWENNTTITEGNVWKWGGGDNDSFWITKNPINATHTFINVSGITEHIFVSSFYLKKLSMYGATKTGFDVDTKQGLIIKMWDPEIIRGRSANYIGSLYFDTAWGTTAPSDPIEMKYCNCSFDPDNDDPRTSANCVVIGRWDANRWVNHSWVPGSNSAYAYPLVTAASGLSIDPDEVGYIYFSSDVKISTPYILNATDIDPGICNITYAQTNTMWTFSTSAGTSAPVAYTPSFFATFTRNDQEFLHHLYIADTLGEWGHSEIFNISIGVSSVPVDPVIFEYFNVSCVDGYTLDDQMDATYDSGNLFVGIHCLADPDGGKVDHNLTLHYANETFIAIINNTFNTTGIEDVDINFSTIAYYSTDDAYTLKCVSIDDEGSVATRWLDSDFTLAADGTQGYYVNDYLMFWGMNDIPTLYSVINDASLISYNAGDDIYTMHVPFFKSKSNDTFNFNETVHLESLNNEDIAYFRFSGDVVFDHANIYGWNTVSGKVAPDTDDYRSYIYSMCQVRGNITNCDFSYLGTELYRQEGLNFIGNSRNYLIYNTTLSHHSGGIIMEDCENFNISHCEVTDSIKSGIGIYYTDNCNVENCTIDENAEVGVYLYEASNNTVNYNTIKNSGEHGLRFRANSIDNLYVGNDITGSVGYDYYGTSSSTNNTIRNPASLEDYFRVTSTSAVNIENTDNMVFGESSLATSYAYLTNFSMFVSGTSQTFYINQHNMKITPTADRVAVTDVSWSGDVSFTGDSDTSVNPTWINMTNSGWRNDNVSVKVNDVEVAVIAPTDGAITYNYTAGFAAAANFLFGSSSGVDTFVNTAFVVSGVVAVVVSGAFAVSSWANRRRRRR